MRKKTGPWAIGLLLAVASVCCASDSRRFWNDAGAVATGLRVQFGSLATITSHTLSFLSVQPWGPATEFVFSAGAVRAGGTFTISWTSTSHAPIVSFEWLTGRQTSPSARPAPVTTPPSAPIVSPSGERCTVTVSSSSPDLGQAISEAYSSGPDEPVVCIEPGTYYIEGFILCPRGIVLRGTGQTASQVVITCAQDKPAEIAAVQDATVTLENVEIRYADLGAYQSSRLLVKNAIVGTVYATEKSVVDIEASVVRRGEGEIGGLEGMTGDTNARVGIRNCAVEWVLSADLASRLSVADSLFRGPVSRVVALDHAQIDIRDCAFDPLSRGIALGPAFAGTVAGTGNRIALSALSPSLSAYAWPTGFVK